MVESRFPSTVPSSPNLFKRVFLPVLGLFLAAALLVRLLFDADFRGGVRDAAGMLNPQFLKQWWRIGHVMEISHQNYLYDDKVAYDKLADTALGHLLDGADRYSDYMTPREFRDFNNESAQRPVGVGVEIERRNGRVEIIRVFNHSPASLNGWKPNDRIVAINNVDVRDFTVTGVSELLRGPDGTKVTVTRETPGEAEHTDTLTRGGFDVPNVRDMEKRADGVGYLRITQFGEKTGDDFKERLRALMEPAALRGLILDLRENPGGLLDQTREVLEPLLPPKTLVVTTEGRKGSAIKSLFTPDADADVSDPGHPHDVHLPEINGQPLPIIVLVNENTASAAEIVAGALQDYHRAIILGARTYGKGIVQSIIDLNDGSGLRLTTEAYFLPTGRTIQDKGITPDVPMAQSADEHDLLRYERSDTRTDLNRFTPEQFAGTFGFAPTPDPQVETAASLIIALTPNYTK